MLTMDKDWRKFNKKFLECHKICTICGGTTKVYCKDCKYIEMINKESIRATCKHPKCETPFMRNEWYNVEVEISFGCPDFMNRHNDCKLFEAKEVVL